MKKRTTVTAIAIVVGVLGLVFCASLSFKTRDCEKKIQAFMAGLINGQVDKSCDEFLSGSQIVPDAAQVLKDKTREAFAALGKGQAYEFIKEQKYGDSVIRLVYILKCERVPLVWEFYFYKPASAWQLVTVTANFKGQYDLLADK